MSALNAALALAAEGIPVFPARVDKKPACARGFHAASTDPAVIRDLFADGAALIGVPTGATSGLDAIDVDIDPRRGGDAWWKANEHRIPLTRIHVTRSGGFHVLLKHETGVGCSVDRVAPGVDVRGDGGYVIWWPAAGCEVWLGEDPTPWPAWALEGVTRRLPQSSAKVDTANLAPPSATAAAELLRRLPNPLDLDRDDYHRVMLASSGCAALAPDDDEGDVGAAAVAWANRWEGGATYDEAEKWESDWSRRPPISGWPTLIQYAKRLIPGYGAELAAEEFGPLAPLPLADVSAPDCELTEDAVALAFANATEGRLVYDHTAKRWFRWDGARWARDGTDWTFGQARRFVRGVRAKIGPRADAAGRIAFAAAVERAARSDTRLAVLGDVWDRDAWVLGVPGGFVDLRTGVLHPADPKRFISREAGVAPAAPGTPAPLWTKFLQDATRGSAGLQAFLQRLAGYVLTGDVTEEQLTFIYGPGRNGKGVFLGALAAILGDYALTVPIDLFTVGARINSESHRATMVGARLVTSSETETGSVWAESQIKELTGNETPLSARHLYGDPFQFRPQFKLVIVGNHTPRLKARTPAMERRLRIVPFTQVPAEPDPNLKEKLRAEYPAILRWAIDGCLAWQRERLGTCGEVRAATGTYFEGQDLMGEWLAERCELGPNHAAAPAELLADFQAFCRNNGAPAITGPEFREMLDGVSSLRRVTARGLRRVQGVRLLPTAPYPAM